MEHKWFWNIAYFDKPYFEGMFSDFVFPDGSTPKWESLSRLQREFMKWFNKERTKTVLTFPVETMNLLNNKTGFVDEDTADFAAEMYADGHSFFTYTSDSVDSLASCCFSKDTMTLTKSKLGIKIMTFEDVYNYFVSSNDDEFEIYHKGSWAKGKPIKLPNRKMYRVTVDDDIEIVVSDNHLNPTKRGDIPTELLTLDDYLLCTKEVFVLDDVVYFPIELEGISLYKKITSIEEVDYDDDIYCFEMQNENEPYFTLPNGVITHNCRLRNELQENAFSYTLGAGGVSTGSKGVMTININRLVQNVAKGKEEVSLDDISDAVKEQVEKVHKYLLAFNEIIKDSYKAGMLPIYDAGYISLEKQYLTIGVNALPSGAEFLGIKIEPSDEYLKYCEAILKPIYEMNKAARTEEVMFNTEFVPKVCGHKAA